MKDNAYDKHGCGCCSNGRETSAVSNRPTLTSVNYRIGDRSSFFHAMLHGAGRQAELRQWMARDSNDIGVALLDMWAYLGDILTFYQERIANESFLGTAKQRESVLRLAALIHYSPGPGSAAATHVAFVLEADKLLELPVGLRLQSVPGQNQKPQKFELVESLAADAAYNSIRVYPQPASYNPFAQGSTGGLLIEPQVRSKPLSTGASLILFDSKRAELKQILKLSKSGHQTELAFSSPVTKLFSGASLYTSGRQFRVFGSMAPPTYMEPEQVSTAPGGIVWKQRSTDYNISLASGELPLEMRVDDIKTGTQLLIVYPGPSSSSSFTARATLTAASAKQAQRGPLAAVVTHLSLSFVTPPPSSQIDLRRIEIHELIDAPIQFSTSRYGPHVSGSSVCVPQDLLASFPVGRTVAFTDSAGGRAIATVSATSVVAGHLKISFLPALTNSLETASALMFGNVAEVTHGETVRDEVLGNGDASKRFQTFQLSKAPVTHTVEAGAPNGVASSLEIRVDGVKWEQAQTLLGQSAQARVYTTQITDDGKTTVRFGGDPGSRLTTGRANVRATYRQGLGPDGNAAAGKLTTLLDRPAGLKSVSNPLAASGGSSAESLEQARANAPNTVRTFGRIVSLRDFADAARELSLVFKANASLEWSGSDQAVVLTVAGENGALLDPIRVAEITADLNTRRDTNRKMRVRAHTNVPIRVRARVQVRREYLLEEVKQAVALALIDAFSFSKRDLGQPAFQSDVFRICHGQQGVLAVDVDQFRYRNLPGPTIATALAASPGEILSLAEEDLVILPQHPDL